MSKLRRGVRHVREAVSRGTATPSASVEEDGVGTPQSAPGSRSVTRGFFDQYDRFYETSETSVQPWRLNLRYEAIFEENRDAFAHARVLDIASHDGRWSFAALQAGAAHVTGIEARPELVEEALENLRTYGIGDDRVEFVTGDVFSVMATADQPVDVVLCLGFFYHTLRYPELWKRMAQSTPQTMIIDTEVYPGSSEALIRVTDEPMSRQGNAVADDFSAPDLVLTGRPTVNALRLMAQAYGYRLTKLSDWAALLRDNPQADGIGDYRKGKRVTLRFDRQ